MHNANGNGSELPKRSDTFIARKRIIELTGRRVIAQEVVHTLEGHKTAYPGDVVVTGVNGEQWPVPARNFDNIYEVVGPAPGEYQMRIRKRPTLLPMFQTYVPLTITNRGEPLHAIPGDLIVRYGPDDMYPLKFMIFFKTYEFVREATPEEHFDLEAPPPAADAALTEAESGPPEAAKPTVDAAAKPVESAVEPAVVETVTS